ncbi:hypothetical protein HNY73_013492 [Argiope bruennichi]|uniref:Uncharacterized protein n=1 Tax=Argiope bruennichi TaxID=94029 RepID=A0A8T0EY79_ARGBR|nr:hypothetical protein HNY73_013492 [Argiope bruennichi]
MNVEGESDDDALLTAAALLHPVHPPTRGRCGSRNSHHPNVTGAMGMGISPSVSTELRPLEWEWEAESSRKGIGIGRREFRKIAPVFSRNPKEIDVAERLGKERVV